MEIFVVILGVAVIALLALLWHARRGASPDPHLQERLEQMTRQQIELQTQLNNFTQAQETARGELTRTLNEQLTNVTQNMSKNLTDNTAKTGESLNELGQKLALIGKAQKELSELSGQVVGLQNILDNKQARGAFGETRLQDLVLDALPKDSYEFQASLSNGRRADCLIHLPNPPGSVVVDSKFPLEAYRAFNEAQTDSDAQNALKRLKADTLTHAKAIAERYILRGETANAALMFLPSESVFSELHLHGGDIIDKCRALNVYPVSPNTLWLTLNTVRAIMRDVEMNEKAGLIQAEVNKMLEDVARLDERVDNLKRHFNQAEGDLRQIDTSTTKITRSGERITHMEIEHEANALEETSPAAADSPDNRDHLLTP